MPQVFTVFNHGTGGSSLKDPKGEIVNIFGNEVKDNDQGRKDARVQALMGKLSQGDAAYMITEGVASIGDPHRQEIKGSGGYPIEVRKGRPRIRKVDRAYAEMTGTGVWENVHGVITVLMYLAALGKAPDVINMIGWSRGAVTCIRIAWRLAGIPSLWHAKVNIFAVDPVAGPGHNDDRDATEILENVKNYVATLALDERRWPFKPIVPPRLQFKSSQTNRVILRLPGIHRDTAKDDNAAGKVTFNLCARFLKAHGTQLTPTLQHYILTRPEVLAEYVKLVQGRDASHVQRPNAGIMGNSERADQLPHSGLFVNVHHAAVFQRLLPNTYQDYLQGTQQARAYWQQKIQSDGGLQLNDLVLRAWLEAMLERFPKALNEPNLTALTPPPQVMVALAASNLV